MKNSTFTALVAGACLAICLACLGGVGLWIVLRPSRLGDVSRDEIRALPDIPAESALTIPLSSPLEVLERFANEALPPTMSWEDGAVTRGQIGVAGRDGVLHATVPVSGRGRRGMFQVEGTGVVSLGLRPRFTEDFGVALNPQVEVTLSEVRPSLAIMSAFSLEELVRPQVQSVVEQGVRQFEPVASDAVRSWAEQAWSSPCREFPVFPESDLRGEARFSAVSVTQPVIDGNGIRLELGLHGSVRIPADTSGVRCAPAQLNVLEGEGGGGGLPLEVGYQTLNEFLASGLAGKSFVGDGVEVHIAAVNVGPYYDGSLLVDARVFARNAGLLPANEPIRILLVIAPRLDVDTQSILLSVEELDTESRNPLVAIAGEMSESRIREAFESEMRAALAPLTREAIDAPGGTPLGSMLREVADDVVDDVLDRWENAYLRADAAVDSVRLVGLEVGRARMRVIVRPHGSVVLVAPDSRP